MFTGIIKHQGKIQAISGTSLTIEAEPELIKLLKTGDSVSLNGVCLTVKNLFRPKIFTVDVMPDTLRVTNVAKLKVDNFVNLELPAQTNSFLGGHIVQGHVDGTAIISGIESAGRNHVLELKASQLLMQYMVEKGSVTLNGISLTIITTEPDKFSVGIIPHTWKHTSLQYAKGGDLINVEVDILAKYVHKFIKLQTRSKA